MKSLCRTTLCKEEQRKWEEAGAPGKVKHLENRIKIDLHTSIYCRENPDGLKN